MPIVVTLEQTINANQQLYTYEQDNKGGSKESTKKTNNNNKATGDDGIQLELIKYGPDILFEEISNNLNYTLEQHSTEIVWTINTSTNARTEETTRTN